MYSSCLQINPWPIWSQNQLLSFLSSALWHGELIPVGAGSQHTRSHPWQGHEEKTVRRIRKADQVFRDSEKLPPALTLKMISVFLMLASIDYSLISVTQAEGLPHLFPNKNQFRTLINKFPRWWYLMRLCRMKGVFQFKLLCWYFSLFGKCYLCPWY